MTLPFKVVEAIELVFKDFVPENIYSRLAEPHTDERPGIPLIWMLSYRASGALQNIRYFENGVRHCKLEFPIRVFLSNWTDAILVSFVPLEAVCEPHVQEWHVTFYEVDVETAKERLTKFPRFPYDGRNPDLVRAQMLVDGDVKKLLKRSKDKLLGMGVPIESRR